MMLARIARSPESLAGASPAQKPHEASGEGLGAIFDLLLNRTGADFSSYKTATVQRRLRHRMAAMRIRTVADYAAHLRKEPAEVDALPGVCGHHHPGAVVAARAGAAPAVPVACRVAVGPYVSRSPRGPGPGGGGLGSGDDGNRREGCRRQKSDQKTTNYGIPAHKGLPDCRVLSAAVATGSR